MILAIFDLQVTPLLPTKFQVKWPFRVLEPLKMGKYLLKERILSQRSIFFLLKRRDMV